MLAARTGRLRSALGINAPIIQSGMAGVAGPDLCAAVSNAGGLGVLASLRLPPDQVRAGIQRLRELTDQPFGVNIWLHDDVRHNPDPEALGADTVRRVQDVLNEMRPRFDLPPNLDPPPPSPDLVDDALEVMIAERIPVFSSGLGVPEPGLVERFHRAGTKVITMVGTVDDAVAAVDAGVDVIVAQGSEAGGHRSFGRKRPLAEVNASGLFSFLPAVTSAIGDRVPVAASGGIVDGATLAAALVLGAEGALMGSRFVATAESMASSEWKAALTSPDRSTVLTDGFTGQWARVLRCEFSDRWADAGVAPLPGLLQAAVAGDVFGAAKRERDDQFQPLYAGANAARITSSPTAAEVVALLLTETERALTGTRD